MNRKKRQLPQISLSVHCGHVHTYTQIHRARYKCNEEHRFCLQPSDMQTQT